MCNACLLHSAHGGGVRGHPQLGGMNLRFRHRNTAKRHGSPEVTDREGCTTKLMNHSEQKPRRCV